MLTENPPVTVVAPTPATPRQLRGRAIRIAAILVLAWFGLTFLLRDPLHYLIDVTPESFGRFWPNRPWLVAHIIGGLAAILIGPFQFSTRIRPRYINLHRWSGRTYLAGILLAGGTAFYLAFFAQQVSFGIALFVLAIVWWFTAGAAFIAIRRRQIAVHRRWMIRSTKSKPSPIASSTARGTSAKCSSGSAKTSCPKKTRHFGADVDFGLVRSTDGCTLTEEDP